MGWWSRRKALVERRMSRPRGRAGGPRVHRQGNCRRADRPDDPGDGIAPSFRYRRGRHDLEHARSGAIPSLTMNPRKSDVRDQFASRRQLASNRAPPHRLAIMRARLPTTHIGALAPLGGKVIRPALNRQSEQAVHGRAGSARAEPWGGAGREDGPGSSRRDDAARDDRRNCQRWDRALEARCRARSSG